MERAARIVELVHEAGIAHPDRQPGFLVELAPEIADGPRSVILDQVSNGIATRMAIFYLLSNEETAA